MCFRAWHSRSCLVAALAGAVALLPVPDVAAKVSCEERGAPPDGIVLRGLPASPIAGRTYTLTVVTSTLRGPNHSPYLGTAYCSHGRVPHHWPHGSFLPVAGASRGVFSLDVRFPEPGLWAVSLMDLDGSFRDLGLRRARPAGSVGPARSEASPAPSPARPPRSPARSGGLPALGLGAGLGCVALAAGSALVVRRRRHR